MAVDKILLVIRKITMFVSGQGRESTANVFLRRGCKRYSAVACGVGYLEDLISSRGNAKAMPKWEKMEHNELIKRMELQGCQNEPRDFPKHTLRNRVE